MEVIKAPHLRFTALACLPNMQLVAGFDNGLTQIYTDICTYSPAFSELPPQGKVTDIAVFSGTRLAISYNDSYVRFYDTEESKHLGIMSINEGYVNAFAVLSDNHRIAFGANNGKIYLFDTVSGDSAGEWSASIYAGIRSLAVLPDGRLASGSDDGVIKVWDSTTWNCRQVIKAHQAPVTCLAALPDGRLASSSNDGTVRVWNGTDLDWSAMFEGDLDWAGSLVALPGGRLAGGSASYRQVCSCQCR